MRLDHRKLVKVGVFYDGNYFLHVSNYYNYVHERRARISISGLHNFIRMQVAQKEGVAANLSQIVDAHYFRCRLNAKEASQKGNLLYYDRVFDDILMSEGVITHYLPFKNHAWKRDDNEIDVWLALEAFELAIYKQFDVVVLITSDGGYVPLVKKLNTLGTRVMLLSWDFEYTNQEGSQVITRTSHDLMAEATYPVPMHEIIDDPENVEEPIVNELFVQTEPSEIRTVREVSEEAPIDGERYTSEILSIKTGYGFIKYPNNNLFFYHEDVENMDFNELQEGDTVEFVVSLNEEGQNVAKNVRILLDYEN